MRADWMFALAAAVAAPAFADCRSATAYSDDHHGLAVLVVRNGHVVCATGKVDTPYELYSGTKSMVGLAAAAAVQDGLLRLDEKVSDTIVEWRGDPLKRDATVAQLLAMSAGLPSQIGRPPGYAAAIGMPFNAAPGTRFQYGPAPMQVFGALLERKLATARPAESAQSYIERRIFNPIGFRYGTWRTGEDGKALLPQGLIVSAREWAKIGALVLNGGRADGRKIVDGAAFARLFQSAPTNASYGLTWWLAKGPPSQDRVTATFDIARDPGRFPSDTVAAAGAGNQRLFVIPSMGTVVVRLATLDVETLLSGKPAPVTASGWSDTAFLEAALSK